MIAAIYARVSTKDQNCDLQLRDLRDFAERSGWATVEYVDTGFSGSMRHRPALDRLLADARLKKFGTVLVWKMDRFGRSLQHLIENVQLLDFLGIRFIAPSQSIDTDGKSPTGKFLMHIFAAFAEFERDLIIERVKAGVAEYKRAFSAGEIGRSRHSRSGKDLAPHRPSLIFRRDEAIRLRATGMGWRTIGRRLGVSPSSIRRACGALPKVVEKLG
jgi:DNA invertase Pin-like site-specific DNA recombinase